MIGVDFVEDEEVELVVEEHSVELPQEQVLQHGIVGHEDIGAGLGVADFLSIPNGLLAEPSGAAPSRSFSHRSHLPGVAGITGKSHASTARYLTKRSC